MEHGLARRVDDAEGVPIVDDQAASCALAVRAGRVYRVAIQWALSEVVAVVHDQVAILQCSTNGIIASMAEAPREAVRMLPQLALVS